MVKNTQNKPMFPDKIAIIGVGLIGGSISLGLKKVLGTKITIFGLCKNEARTFAAKQSGIIDKIMTIKDISRFDFVIIALPIHETIELIRKLPVLISKDCLVMDVSGIKKEIMKTSVNLPDFIRLIGTHPMAGSDLAGFENADPLMFMNKPWIICPEEKTQRRELFIVKNLVNLLGAEDIVMDADTHDKLVSISSHLELISSSLIAGSVFGNRLWDKASKTASTGFRDITRLAGHDPGMKADIAIFNKKNVLNTLISLKKEIDLFMTLTENGNKLALFNYFNNIKKTRDRWLYDR